MGCGPSKEEKGKLEAAMRNFASTNIDFDIVGGTSERGANNDSAAYFKTMRDQRSAWSYDLSCNERWLTDPVQTAVRARAAELKTQNDEFVVKVQELLVAIAEKDDDATMQCLNNTEVAQAAKDRLKDCWTNTQEHIGGKTDNDIDLPPLCKPDSRMPILFKIHCIFL